LAANGTYHFRVRATNPGGSSYGSDQTFKMLPTPPTVVTEAPSAITQTSATLLATVNPNGGTPTSCEFEFGSSEAHTPCATMPGSGEGPVAVSASVHGLIAGATYAYRVIASNAGGTSYGAIQVITTQPPAALAPPALFTPIPTTPPVPDAELASTALAVSATGAVTVTVRCPAGESRCIGTITLRTLTTVNAGAGGHPAAKRILTLATGPFTVAGGRVAKVKLRLSAKARGLLAREHVLRVRATILAHDTAGAAHISQATVALHAPRRTPARNG
jgi:hypothetical protein